jgi:site-specific recombinase XerD
VDFEQHQIMVHDPKGMHDRTTILPVTLKLSLRAWLQAVKHFYERDFASGHGEAALPNTPAQKYPNAAKEEAWQFFFRSSKLFPNPYDGRRKPIASMRVYCQSRSTGFQQSVFLQKCRPLYLQTQFYPHIFEAGYDNRTVQELFGHKDVKTQ